MRIGVVGGGAWGTALAQTLASDGETILLWAYEEEVTASINTAHVNQSYLPTIPLSPS